MSLAIALAIVGAMFGSSVFIWTDVEDGKQIAVHWDYLGRTNGFADKYTALFSLPVAALFATAISWLSPLIGWVKRDFLLSFLTVGVPGVLAVGHGMILLYATGFPIGDYSPTFSIAVVLFCIIAVFLKLSGRQTL
ncbi:MAG: hypothetical protein ABL888_02885 [Pirellulaceae bacterium]